MQESNQSSNADDQSDRSNDSSLDNIEVEEKEREDIAKTESTIVSRLRVIVLLVLIVSAIVVSLLVNRFMSYSEKNEFESQFHSDANKVLDSVGKGLDQTIGATDAFATEMVGYALSTNSTWPFVTMRGFAVHASKLLRLSRAFYLGFSPLVKPQFKEKWEQYAANSNTWVDEGLDIQEKDEEYFGPINRNYTTVDVIYDFRGPMNTTGPFADFYLPMWQNTPVVPTKWLPPYNFDEMMVRANALGILECFQNQVFTINNYSNVIWEPDNAFYMNLVAGTRNWMQNFVEPGDPVIEEPTSTIVYPIFDSLDSVRIDLETNHTPAGVLMYLFFWRDLITYILPENSKGIIVVFSSACQDSFTYQLNGPKATFLGVGDLHDPKYDHLGYSSLLSDLMGRSESPYTGLPMSKDFCPKAMAVYPSQMMEDQFVTKDPVYFSVVAAFIFVFTSFVFVTYDLVVARRQRIVKNRALASSEIVDSMFPEKVRQQLYLENEEKRVNETLVRNFINNKQQGSVKSAKPIADLFEETTILFADLAGFTKWSSTRTPIDVFELLETLYGAFDEIAKKRRVFKVETIGDCYVAVTGIPDPQDHAVIMVRFARDCMNKMNELKTIKAQSLGEDTADLQFRVGMHSGSVTAGVLRGEKGRFQLFGDTMNTASRMESNGVPGRIHCSQATADALTARGKDSWLVPREEKIVAKGKGEMQTYFVLPQSPASCPTDVVSSVCD